VVSTTQRNALRMPKGQCGAVVLPYSAAVLSLGLGLRERVITH
jgi:hypothetical protein